MEDKKVLILSSLAEVSTARVAKHISELGARPVVVNFEEAATGHTWSARLDDGPNLASYGVKSGVDSLTSPFCSVWFRRWGYPVFPNSFSNREVAYSYGEFAALILGLESMDSVRWINRPSTERVASNKLRQLMLAKELGFKVPPTLVTTDPDSVIDFWKQHGDLVFKPTSGASMHLYAHTHGQASLFATRNPTADMRLDQAQPLAIYTQKLTQEHLSSLRDLRWAPTVFQKLITKRHELRVTTVGCDIFTCEIYSQAREDTAIDFRHMNVTGLVPHKLVDTPQHIRAFVHTFMERERLEFGCFDFIIERDTEECYFLEVNPGGQWQWIEDLTGAPISRALASLLVNGKRSLLSPSNAP